MSHAGRGRPPRLLVVLAVIALAEGLSFLAYSLYYIVQEIRIGPTGPAEVSTNTTIVLQIVLFALFGLGMLAVAWGWWTSRRWARGPFILAQFLTLVVSVPLAGSLGSVERGVGIVFTALALVGVVISLTPAVTRLILADD